MGESVDRRDEIALASSCTCPSRLSRPCTNSTCSACVDRLKLPWGCRVFQGAPKPHRTDAGQSDWPSCTVACTPPRRGWSCKDTGVTVQQLDSSVMANWLQWGRSVQDTRPGKVAASRLPAAPMSASCAEPFQTVPRGVSSKARPLVACSSVQASQRAGANAAFTPCHGGIDTSGARRRACC